MGCLGRDIHSVRSSPAITLDKASITGGLSLGLRSGMGLRPTFKRTSGFHPLTAWCDNTDESLVVAAAGQGGQIR